MLERPEEALDTAEAEATAGRAAVLVMLAAVAALERAAVAGPRACRARCTARDTYIFAALCLEDVYL